MNKSSTPIGPIKLWSNIKICKELFELKKFSANFNPSFPILLLLIFNISKTFLLCSPGNNNFAHLSSMELLDKFNALKEFEYL